MYDLIKSITTTDVRDWAGITIYERAQGYLTKVRDFARYSENSVIADSGNYYVYVDVAENKRFYSACTCPCHFSPCKHAVAALIVLINNVKNGMQLPNVHPDDGRLDELELDYHYDHMPVKKTAENLFLDNESIRIVLDSTSKEELVWIIMDSLTSQFDLQRNITAKELIRRGDYTSVINHARSEIENIIPAIVYDQHFRKINRPDFEFIRSILLHLRKAGQFDNAIRLGELLFQQVTKLLDYSEDDREIESETYLCMMETAKAVMESGMSEAEKIYWLLRHESSDYIAPDHVKMLDGHTVAPSVWVECVFMLKERIHNYSKGRAELLWEERQVVESIIKQICLCYQNAGRPEEYFDFLKENADKYELYSELADAYIQTKRADEGIMFLHSRLTEEKEDWQCALIRKAAGTLIEHAQNGDLAEMDISVITIEPYVKEYKYNPHFSLYEIKYLRFNISIDGKSIDGDNLTVSISEIKRSIDEAGEFHFFSCICGEEGCAGFAEPLTVRHHVCKNGKTYIDWDYGYDDPKYVRFELEQYKSEINTAVLKGDELLKQYPKDSIDRW